MFKKAVFFTVVAMVAALIPSAIYVAWAGCGLFGDLNDDGKVDIADIMIVANCWRSTNPAEIALYDFDRDGDIDVVDIMLVATRWGSTCPPSFGVHTFNFSSEAMTLASQADVHWIGGVWLAWSSVEPDNRDLTNNPESGNWGLDSRLSDLVEAGFTPLVTICCNPSWAASTDCGPIDIAPLSEFAEFVWAAAERYDGDGDYNGDGVVDGPTKPLVKYWEFWNEADFDPENTIQPYHHGGCWGNNGAAYAEMLYAAYPALKQGNPEAQLVFSGIAYDRFTPETAPPGYPSNWYGPFNYNFVGDVLDHLYTNYGAETDFPFFDIMNVHIYNDFRNYWDGTSLPYDQEMLGKVKHLKNDELYEPGKYDLRNMPLVVTEVGIPSEPTDQWTNRSEDLQAIYAAQTLVRGEVLGLVANLWFSLVDFQHELNFKYGLLKDDAQLSRKLAYTAYDVATEELAGAVYDRQLTTAETGSANIEAHRFTMPDGGKKIVLWTDTGERLGKKEVSPITRTMAFTNDHFAGEWTGQLRVVDKLGNETILDDGGTGSISIQITQSPIYVEVTP